MSKFMLATICLMAIALGTLLAPRITTRAQTQGEAKVTFQLTIHGRVMDREHEAFRVLVRGSGPQTTRTLMLCGSYNRRRAAACEGGASYRVGLTVPAGSRIGFSFQRILPGGGTYTFHTGTQTINHDVTIGAEYDFSLVPVTFKLTLYGRVPPGEAFYVSYGFGFGESLEILLCGKVEPRGGSGLWGSGGSAQPCKGNGTVYVARHKLEADTPVGFGFARIKPSGNAQFFYKGKRLPGDNPLFSAWYSFGSPNGEQLPNMPQTGAGGMRTLSHVAR